jgi:MoaA/NifB/PqqE/SkfB family radical SAM enzyme
MIQFDEIREVHLELSTNCNARCPLCPRNFNGFPYNAGYPVTELSLEDCKTIFSPQFVSQLRHVLINGNLGDFMLAGDALEIVDYFIQHNTSIKVSISTNGGARNKSFWQALARPQVVIEFCLDGLEDTHHLYRMDTKFETVLENAQTFIQAGGCAVWKMVKFEHNEHQIVQARALSKQLGFARFQLVDHGRNDGLAFDRQGNLSHMLGSKEKHLAPITSYINWRKKSVENKAYWNDEIKEINCTAKKRKSIYLNAGGEVYPCCWLGYFPRTYGLDLHKGNAQICEMLHGVENNAKVKPLNECIEWFNKVESSWTIDSFEKGRTWLCNHECGLRSYEKFV